MVCMCIRLSGNVQQPQYLRELLNDLPARPSNNALLIVPSTTTVTAARAFRVAALQIWNNLPNQKCNITVPILSPVEFERTLIQHLRVIAMTTRRLCIVVISGDELWCR